jgi:hypothetical protein
MVFFKGFAMARQFVVTSRDQVPENFIALSQFGPPGTNGNGTPEYNAIQAAWVNKKISGCKLYRSAADRAGPVFIDNAEAEKILRSLRDSQATAEQAVAEAAADAEPIAKNETAGIASALRSILFELRRIGDAAEALAQARSATEWQTNG